MAPAPAPTGPDAGSAPVAASHAERPIAASGNASGVSDREVEEHRAGHDRHARGSDRVADAALPQPERDAGRGLEAEARFRPRRPRAWISDTRLPGVKMPVSRVPGAPPRTSTAAIVPGGGRITVQPVRRTRIRGVADAVAGREHGAMLFDAETVSREP